MLYSKYRTINKFIYLESKTGDQVMEIIEQVNKEGITVVLVTNDESVAKRTDRIIQMSDGQII